MQGDSNSLFSFAFAVTLKTHHQYPYYGILDTCELQILLERQMYNYWHRQYHEFKSQVPIWYCIWHFHHTRCLPRLSLLLGDWRRGWRVVGNIYFLWCSFAFVSPLFCCFCGCYYDCYILFLLFLFVFCSCCCFCCPFCYCCFLFLFCCCCWFSCSQWPFF